MSKILARKFPNRYVAKAVPRVSKVLSRNSLPKLRSKITAVALYFINFLLQLYHQLLFNSGFFLEAVFIPSLHKDSFDIHELLDPVV